MHGPRSIKQAIDSWPLPRCALLPEITILLGWPASQGGGDPPNAAPTDITLSAATIASDAAASTVVGALTATDVDDSSFTWAITNGNTKFELSASTGSTVNLRRSATGTLAPGVNEAVTIQVTDGGSNIYSEGFTITVPDPSAEALLETVTLNNFSGASRTNPYIYFRRAFEPGEVPSGTHVELRIGGTLSLQQADARTLHTDGSLRMATFSAKSASGAMADNATLSVDLYKVSGAFSNSTSIVRTTLTAQDYRVECVIGGITYYCLLNNCDAAGNFIELRAGNTVRAWRHWGVLRDGTTGGSTDQGELQATFYSYVWEDGRINVWADVINGRVANGGEIAVTTLVLRNGAAAPMVSHGAFTFSHRTAVAMCGADALPSWSSSATDIWASVDALYTHEKKLLWNVHSTPTERSAIGAGSAIDYAANSMGDIGTAGIDSAGGNIWIGFLPNWAFLALLTNNKTRLRNDRVNSLNQMAKCNGWFRNHTTGFVPVLNNTNYTASGLSAAQPTIGWGSGATIATTGSQPAGAEANFSHGPEYTYFQWMATGWEWWHDYHVHQYVACLGNSNPGNQTYQRNAIINGIQFRGVGTAVYGQARAIAWGLRTIGNLAWTSPDGYPTTQYMRDILTESMNCITQQMTAPYAPSTQDALGIWLTGEGTAENVAQAMWMHGYLSLNGMMMLHRGYITAAHKIINHVEKFYIGFHNACPYHAFGVDRAGIREGSAPEFADPIAQSWDTVYKGGDGAGLQTVKLISDAGGVSGSCPVSGMDPVGNEAYAGSHTYSTIGHAVMAIANMLSLTGASSALTYAEGIETAAGVSESSWANGQPGWRIRAPS